ncbi:MAG: HAD family hydrolase [Acidobacteriota bacterium]|nr:HAD family hydrolase [Acidobacteriota bacterium]
MALKLVAFDADDTLWHNERLFLDVQARFLEIVGRHTDSDIIEQRLYETEVANLGHYGYGVKSFTLSMVETAIDLTEGRITGRDVGRILDLGREMLLAPVDVLEGVPETITRLSESYDLMVLTKGDLLDQETKIARSGLGDLFTHVEVVSRKDRSTYEDVLDRYGLEPREFVMIGNSLRSDILPVVEMGAHAIFVPYESTWEHEAVPEREIDPARFHTAGTIRAVPDLVASLP